MPVCSFVANVVSQEEILWLFHLQEFMYIIYDHYLIINSMLSRLITTSIANFTKSAKPKNVRQRVKFYSRYPDVFRRKTIIRPPDLTEPNIVFPIEIPVRVRHQFHLKKQLIVPNSSKIQWHRLQPNQILLGFQKIEYLTFKQVLDGLRYLSQVKGQQLHDWNSHQWVSKALNLVRQNTHQIKKKDIMNFYFLMKKLTYTDQEFWKKMYRKIQDNIYDLYPHQFSYIYLTYYDSFEKVFSSPEVRKNFDKLMEGRLRQFAPAAIVQVFQKFLRDKKIDNYWLQNVFISLFKNNQYIYNASQIAAIFRAMMILQHENNERFYENLYLRIRKLNFKTLGEVDLLTEVLEEVKQIFTSHRVDPTLEFLAQKKIEVQQASKQVKKKTIQQMVRDDLKYFLQKRKLKEQEKGASAAPTPATP